MYIKRFTTAAVMLLVLFASISVRGEYIDIENEALENKISVLEQLGFLDESEDAAFHPSAAVSRGEFAVCAAKLLALSPVSGESIFSDVEEDADYCGYINALSQAGLISGTEDSVYAPQRDITYTESVKILLSGMGYGALCEIEGGWPEGYLKEASKQKLGTAVSGSLTREGLAKLLYDGLTARIMEPYEVSGATVSYKESDETLMEKLHGLYLIEGVMTYNGSVSTDGTEKNVLPYMVAGGVRVELDGRECRELIGYNVSVFAYSPDSKGAEYRLRAVVPKTGRNKSVTVNAENIEDVSGGELICAERGRKTDKYRLGEATVIYNGSYMGHYDDALLKPKEGFVRIVDNDSDGRYELAIVYDTVDDVINGVNASLESLNLDSLGYVELKDMNVDIYVNGKLKSITDVSSDCAISIAFGGDSHITMWVSTEKISGTLSAFGEDYIALGDASCPTSEYFDADSLKLGNMYTAYITGFGKAVKLKLMSKDEHYGYLISVIYENEYYMSDGVRLRMIADDGSLVKSELSESATIDGKRLRLEFADFQKYGLIDGSGKGIQQLIKYNVDDEGKIFRISTPKDMTEYGICEDEFSLDKHVANVSTRMYKYNIGINYHIGAATKIFYLPLESETAYAQTSDYTAGTIGSFSQDISYSNFDIYDTRPDRTAGVIVIRRTIQPTAISGKLTDSLMKRNLGVITKCKSVYIEDEVETEITMLTSGKEVKLYPNKSDLTNSTQDVWSYPQITADKLAEGDIIIYSLNESGKISDYTILFRGEELKDKAFLERVPSNLSIDEYNDVALCPLHTVFGEVCAINGRTYSINVSRPQHERPLDKEMRHLVATAASQVYVLDYVEGKIRIGETADIAEGDIVFARAYNYVPQQIVIFRGEQR